MIAISSAFDSTLIALENNGKKDYLTFSEKAKQSELLLDFIDKLLEKNNLSIQDNKDFAVVVGPGSFTGLRVGISLIKGLCAGLGQERVVPVTSFELMARENLKNKPKGDFLCVINALSGLVFVCEYSSSGEKIGQERVIEREELNSLNIDKIGLAGENIVEKEVTLTAQSLLEIALVKLGNGQFCSAKEITPLYLRKSQAEAELDKKKGKKEQ